MKHSNLTPTAQKRVWVDTDITIGHANGLHGYCDVDDGYALAALFRCAEVEVIGISTTLGNTHDINLSTRTALNFVHQYGPNRIAVHAGQPAPLSDQTIIRTPSEGVQQLAAALEDEPLTILCIGAVTNIAVLLQHYPHLIEHIDELVVVAGRRSIDQHFVSGHWQPRPFHDLNFEFDVPAFEVLLNSTVNLTLVPYEVCNQLWIHPKDLLTLGKANKVGRFLAEHSAGWLAEWEGLFGANGFNPFDLVAAAYVIHPEKFVRHTWGVSIETAPDDCDSNHNKPYLLCSEQICSHRTVNYCIEMATDIKDRMFAHITTHDMSAYVLGLSHINIIVPDIDEATAYYHRVLGFEQACDHHGTLMDYPGVEMKPFALDAGLLDGQVNVDVRFLKHPQANIYLELMKYHTPQGTQHIQPQPRTYDMGGPRHIALEVSNCNETFEYLKNQPGVTMINPRSDYHPVILDGFPITFFYWVDQYGIQWEMEEGRQVGTSRGVV